MRDEIFEWLDGMRADASGVGRTDRPQPKRNRLRSDLAGAGAFDSAEGAADWEDEYVLRGDLVDTGFFICGSAEWDKSLGELVADAVLDAGGDCICPLGLPVCDGSHACGRGLE